MAKFSELLGVAVPGVTIVDVGAASMGAGTDPYDPLLSYPEVRVIGFEPDAAACARRNAECPPGHRFYPYFIADGQRRTFHHCVNPLTSSLYEPDNALLGYFSRLQLQVASRSEVDTVRMDDLEVIERADYVKLDVQGAELDVIRNAQRVLANALVVHTEVEFIPMYKGQPCFGEIDVELRRQGFLLHNFVNLFTRQLNPMVFNNDPFHAGSQLVFAEAAVYVRDLRSIESLEAGQLLKLAAILHDVYRSVDMAGMALAQHDRRTGGALLQRYVEALSPRPAS